MISKNMNQKKIEHMKNIILIGGMIMKKLGKEGTVNKKKNLETHITNEDLPNYYEILGSKNRCYTRRDKEKF